MFEEFKNQLLSNKIIKTRDYVLCRKKVDEKMAIFEEYNYKYNEIKPPKITSNYEIKYEMFTNRISDKVGNFVAKRLDLLREVDKLYMSLCEILKKCTKEELIYFTGVYINHLAEDIICEKLNMSSSSLKRIKKSCIIKIAMHFDIDVMATKA